MADLMAVVRKALGRESTPIDVPPIPSVALTPDSKFDAHERRIGVLESKVRGQAARLTAHIRADADADERIREDYRRAEALRGKKREPR